MINPKVSIVVPVYKVEQYLPATIDSLLRQDYENFEIVLVDDGSPDESGAICDEFATHDDRIIVLHKSNGGVTSARKAGVEVSTGEWIVFVDGDDLLADDALSIWIRCAIQHNADYVLTPMLYCGEKGSKLSNMRLNGEYTAQQFRYLLCNGYANCGIGGRIIAKCLFSENTFSIPPEIVNNEDLFMNLNLTRTMERMYALSNKGLYKYILRKDSASHTMIPESNWTAAYNEALRLIPEYGNCMGMYILLSLYHRVLFKGLPLEHARSWINRIPNVQSFPLRLRIMYEYILRPSKWRYYYMRLMIKLLDCFSIY